MNEKGGKIREKGCLAKINTLYESNKDCDLASHNVGRLNTRQETGLLSVFPCALFVPLFYSNDVWNLERAWWQWRKWETAEMKATDLNVDNSAQAGW